MSSRAPARKRKLSKAGARRVVLHAAKVAADVTTGVEAEPDPDGDDLDPDEDFGGPALPAVPEAAPKVFAPPADEIAELVKRRPSDPLAAATWMHELMMLQLGRAAVDPEIPDHVRRKESRTIALTADRLTPKHRLHQAEQTVLRAEKRLEEKQAARAGARLRDRMTGVSVKDPGAQET